MYAAAGTPYVEDSSGMLRENQTINDAGHLVVGGCDAVELAAKFGTPLYVLDEQAVRQQCRRYREAFGNRLDAVEVAYASKALITTAMCRIMQQEGMAIDVASEGELYTALEAGFPPERIKLHGNFKKPQLLRMALEGGIGRIVADSHEELQDISRIAGELQTQADILIRLAPGVKADTHEKIRTGQDDSKFGIGIASSQAMNATKLALKLPGVNLHGYHCHIGSQLLHTDNFVRTVDVIMAFIARVREETGFVSEQFDIGGGLGICYMEDDAPPTIDALGEAICGQLKEAAAEHDLPVPELILEPGRSIVGEAGITLYTLGVIKQIPLIRTYASVDGGLSDNPRPVMYDAEYEALIANRADAEPATLVRLSGAHCETDTLIDEVLLADPQPGDIVAVQCTGAYNYAMASNYNRFLRPAMVLVNDGQADIIVERETLPDLVAHDIIPDRLS